jgi:CubicO group peptidase (beta-lactamase class C family)
VGLAIGEGKLSLDDRVLSFFPDDAPAEPSENLRAMRVRDLLTMSTGHESEPILTAEKPWVRSFLAHPVPRPPGTHFVYNSTATYTLSAIVQKVTGQKLLEYLQPRLFEPLGIENAQWDDSPQGISVGGWGLRIRTEDIAKFGLLYAQRGRWNGRQLLPETWADQATAKQVANGTDPGKDWTQGYGYQFWRCRHGAYRGDGAFGQFCVVMPEFDAVLAMTADTKDMQGQLNLVWEHLRPAFQDGPLPADDTALAKLRATASTLQVPDGHIPNVLHPPGSPAR